jgi:Domain of unknown function (DUF4394)
MCHATGSPSRAGFAFPLALILAAPILVAGCGGSDNSGPNPPPAGETIYAVDLSNNFALFHSGSPGTVVRKLAITGLPDGDRIVGIDFRPADGKLYGVGTDSRVYVVDTVTAVATAVGAAFAPAADGEHFGMVIDPATDEIRLQAAESAQNLRLDPATGQLVAEDAVLAYAAGDPNEAETPALVATGVGAGAGAPAYGIDWLLDMFVVMNDPTSGEVTTVGSTGVSTAPCAALDLGSDGAMYASMTTGGINKLYTMNLATGAATLVGDIDVFASIQSIAIPD